MDDFEKQQLWEMVWLALKPKKEILNWFRTYNQGQPQDRPEALKYYKKALEKKEVLLRTHKNENFDKLQRAFYNMNQEGIISIHNAGPTMSAGHTHVNEIESAIYQEVYKDKLEYDTSKLKGYCFYHDQDIEEFVPDINSNEIPKHDFYLAFGPLDENKSAMVIGNAIVAILKAEKLIVEWSQNPQSRIKIKDFVWIKEIDEIEWESKTQKDILESYRKAKTPSSGKIEIAQEVLIKVGPFCNFKGIIKEIQTENEMLTLEVSVFGRKTLVTVKSSEIEL